MSETKNLTPVCIVYVDGKRLDTVHEGALRRVVVNDTLNGISTSTLLFDSSLEKIRDKGTFAFEGEVLISMGYKDDMNDVFEGDIVSFRTILPQHGHEFLEVRCANVLHKLFHGNRIRNFKEKKTSEIIEDVIKDYGLSCDVDAFGKKLDFFTRGESTDFELIQNLAHQYGYDIYAFKKKVYVKKQMKVRTDDVIFEHGKTLIYFNVSEDIRNQLRSVRYVSYDGLKAQSIDGKKEIKDVTQKVGGNKDWAKASKGGSGKWESFIIATVTQKIVSKVKN